MKQYFKDFIEAHKSSPTYHCYRFRQVLCKVCYKLKEENPCEILACIDCNQHLFPLNFKHLTSFK